MHFEKGLSYSACHTMGGIKAAERALKRVPSATRTHPYGQISSFSIRKWATRGVEGKENALLGAFWKAFFPHTVQRATVLCPSCHEDPKRFVHANPDKEVYNLKNDGLPLASFFQAEGQVVVNGTFVGEGTLKSRILLEGSHPYATLLVKKWAEILKSLPY